MRINEKIIDEVTRRVINNYLFEARPRNVGDNIIKNRGRKATRLATRIRQIKEKAKEYGLTKRLYDDENKALEEYETIINSFGCEFAVDDERYIQQPVTENGARVGKQFDIRITFDNDIIMGFITLIGYGSEDSPLSEFKTSFSLVDKQFNAVEN